MGCCGSPRCVCHRSNSSIASFLRSSTIRCRNIVTYADQADNSTHPPGVMASKQLTLSTELKLSAGQVNAWTWTWTGSRAEVPPQRGATERSIWFTGKFPTSDTSKASCIFQLVLVLFEALSIWGHIGSCTSESHKRAFLSCSLPRTSPTSSLPEEDKNTRRFPAASSPFVIPAVAVSTRWPSFNINPSNRPLHSVALSPSPRENIPL